MKKFFSLMAVVLAAATVFTSCKKDDEGSYPAKLDGLYANQVTEGTSTSTYSLWIEGEHAEFLAYNANYTNVDTIAIGKLKNYDANNGTGTIEGYNSTLKETVTVSLNAHKGSTTVTASLGEEHCDLRYLTPVGFKSGTWQGDTTYTEVVEITEHLALTVTDKDSSLTTTVGGTADRSYKITHIYGFWEVGDGMSVGTFECVENDTHATNDTTYWLGFRMDDEVSYLTIMEEDGTQYALSDAKTQVTSALAE